MCSSPCVQEVKRQRLAALENDNYQVSGVERRQEAAHDMGHGAGDMHGDMTWSMTTTARKHGIMPFTSLWTMHRVDERDICVMTWYDMTWYGMV